MLSSQVSSQRRNVGAAGGGCPIATYTRPNPSTVSLVGYLFRIWVGALRTVRQANPHQLDFVTRRRHVCRQPRCWRTNHA